MIKEVTLRRYGSSLRIVLPKLMTEHLNLSAGDKLYAVETEQGILLTSVDPEFARVVEVEDRISKRYQNALRELAQ